MDSLTKMRLISVQGPSYLVLHSKCEQQCSNIVQNCDGPIFMRILDSIIAVLRILQYPSLHRLPLHHHSLMRSVPT